MLRRFTIGKPDKHSFRAEPSTGRLSAKASRTGVQNLLSGTVMIVKYSARVPACLCERPQEPATTLMDFVSNIPVGGYDLGPEALIVVLSENVQRLYAELAR